MAPQTLILDADDTLWENNVYFERAFAEFCDYLNHSSLTPDEIRSILDEIEIVNNAIHGYGAVNFGRNLSQCFLRLAERAVDDHDLAKITAMAHQILSHEIDLMPGVAETLPFLAERHDLLICTKGEPTEQTRKIDHSGLRPFFRECIIVREKTRDMYAELVAARNLDPERTWMIGNSPKSDINPSLAAGLRAVLVPHERTWTLEREEIHDPANRMLVAEGFADLLRIFGPAR